MDDLKEAEIRFSVIRPFSDRADELTLVFGVFDDKVLGGVGHNRIEALTDLFRHVYPELKTMEWSPQVSMSNALKDKPFGENGVLEMLAAKDEVISHD